jgi:hypothetical protein
MQRQLAAVMLAFLPGLAAAIDLETVMGEWAIDADSCAESRLTFTIDFMHEALVAEDGRWQSLGAAEFSIDGDTLIIQAESPTGGAAEQRLQVVTAERDRLVLRNDNADHAELVGTDTLELVRCPAY